MIDAGLDVFLFDYRGYGRSEGTPDEEGTYRDARAARSALLRQPGVDGGRVVVAQPRERLEHGGSGSWILFSSYGLLDGRPGR
jgi:hypothetical protein